MHTNAVAQQQSGPTAAASLQNVTLFVARVISSALLLRIECGACFVVLCKDSAEHAYSKYRIPGPCFVEGAGKSRNSARDLPAVILCPETPLIYRILSSLVDGCSCV